MRSSSVACGVCCTATRHCRKESSSRDKSSSSINACSASVAATFKCRDSAASTRFPPYTSANTTLQQLSSIHSTCVAP
jgi:hypothetical protein